MWQELSERKIKMSLEIEPFNTVVQVLLKEDLSASEIKNKTKLMPQQLSHILGRLEDEGAVVYKQGKWSIVKEARQVYAKYYG